MFPLNLPASKREVRLPITWRHFHKQIPNPDPNTCNELPMGFEYQYVISCPILIRSSMVPNLCSGAPHFIWMHDTWICMRMHRLNNRHVPYLIEVKHPTSASTTISITCPSGHKPKSFPSKQQPDLHSISSTTLSPHQLPHTSS